MGHPGAVRKERKLPCVQNTENFLIYIKWRENKTQKSSAECNIFQYRYAKEDSGVGT